MTPISVSTPRASQGSGITACRQRAIRDFPALDPPLRAITCTAHKPRGLSPGRPSVPSSWPRYGSTSSATRAQRSFPHHWAQRYLSAVSAQRPFLHGPSAHLPQPVHALTHVLARRPSPGTSGAASLAATPCVAPLVASLGTTLLPMTDTMRTPPTACPRLHSRFGPASFTPHLRRGVPSRDPRVAPFVPRHQIQRALPQPGHAFPLALARRPSPGTEARHAFLRPTHSVTSTPGRRPSTHPSTTCVRLSSRFGPAPSASTLGAASLAATHRQRRSYPDFWSLSLVRRRLVPLATNLVSVAASDALIEVWVAG
jgi:hypothetical protein